MDPGENWTGLVLYYHLWFQDQSDIICKWTPLLPVIGIVHDILSSRAVGNSVDGSSNTVVTYTLVSQRGQQPVPADLTAVQHGAARGVCYDVLPR